MTPFGVRQFRKLLVGCVAINIAGFALFTAGEVLTGHFLGESALAGVALASPFLGIGDFLMSLLGSGTGINYSIRRGELDRDGAISVFMQGVWTVLACGVGIGLAAWLLKDIYIGFMSANPEVVRNAVEYWRWLPLSLALMCASGLLLNCCYCDGDTAFATIVYCGQCVLTIVVSFSGLRGGFGASACSLGLALGYAFSCILLSLHFFRKGNTFRFRWTFAWRETLEIVRTSAGDALGFLGNSIVLVLLGFVLSHSFGPVALIGLPVYIVIVEFIAYTSGFSSAMQPIVAVYFGEGNYRSTRQTMKSVFGLLATVSTAVSVALSAFPEIVVSLVGIHDSEYVVFARNVVRVTALTILPYTLADLLNNYFQLVRREGLAVVLTLFYWLVLPASMLFVFPRFGELGFWFWSPVSCWSGIVIFAAFLGWRYGWRAFPLLLDRRREAAITTLDLLLRERDVTDVSERVANRLLASGVERERAMRARLLVEETLMVIKERNGEKAVYAEVILDLNDGVMITLRDDGVIFDITDADAKVNGLRTYLVATIMQRQQDKSNILTTGFNRNVFRL